MSLSEPRPLNNTPTSQLIRRTHNNRLGAVSSSLQAFWEARHHAVAAAAAAGHLPIPLVVARRQHDEPGQLRTQGDEEASGDALGH